jgi:hypothetical protein
MSNSNDSSKLGQVRELRDDELENVSGGYISSSAVWDNITTYTSPHPRADIV